STSMIWGRNEQVQNNRFNSGGLEPGDTLKEETGVFQSRLQKQFADSGSFAVSHNWNYALNNVPTRLFGSVYDGNIRAEYRRPLWARSGTEFTRIAGPNATISSGVNQGVVISRINNDITVADFELNMQNLLRDVENAYWDLSLAYRAWHSETTALESALGTWREVKARLDEGLERGSASDEAQARDNYFESQARVESALADLYSSEGQLRRLIGLTVNDGRVIRPKDEASVAEFILDWHMALAEGITRRVELRRQKWQIKSLELQLTAARSLTRPDFDFVSGYQVNGFGDTLIADNDDDGQTPHGLNSGYGSLTQGDQTGWNLGFEFRTPIGFRAARSQVQNLELRLARARAVLSTQELEVSHELSSAFQSLDRWYKTAETNFNRMNAAATRVKASQVDYEVGRSTLDLYLRAQLSLANAEVAYYRSITEYNKAISEVHFRKGSLLEHNNVHIGEGLWEGEAYSDALRRAWARSHAFDNPTLQTEPAEFVTEVPPATPMMRMVPGEVGSYTLHGTEATPAASPSPELAPPAEAPPEPPAQVPKPEPLPLDPDPAPNGRQEPMAAKPLMNPPAPISAAPEIAPKPAIPTIQAPVRIEADEENELWKRTDLEPNENAPSLPMKRALETPVPQPRTIVAPIEPEIAPNLEPEQWRSRESSTGQLEMNINPNRNTNVERNAAPRRQVKLETHDESDVITRTPTKGVLIEPAATVIQPMKDVSSSPASGGPMIQARPAAPKIPAPGLFRPNGSAATTQNKHWTPRSTGVKSAATRPAENNGWAPADSASQVQPAEYESEVHIESGAGSERGQALPDLPVHRWRGTVTPASVKGQSSGK
ncbi:MAG: TolC family protein, partial [Planctomycetaceae bacterium]